MVEHYFLALNETKTAPPIYIIGGAVVDYMIYMFYMQLETPSKVAIAVRMLMAI